MDLSARELKKALVEASVQAIQVSFSEPAVNYRLSMKLFPTTVCLRGLVCLAWNDRGELAFETAA